MFGVDERRRSARGRWACSSMSKRLLIWISLGFLVLPACTTNLPAQPVEPTAQTTEAERATIRLVQALLKKDLHIIESLVADSGVSFPRKWPAGIDPAQIVSAATASQFLAQALTAADPSCVGYNPAFGAEPTRALIVTSGLRNHWAAVGLTEPESDLVGLVLTQSSPNEWLLTQIMQVDPRAHIREIVDLQPCP